MHPAPPGPAPQAMLPPPSVLRVSPSNQTTKRTPVSASRSATRGLLSRALRPSGRVGAVEGSNQGNSASTNLWLSSTRNELLPCARPSATQSVKPSSVPVPSTCGFASSTTPSSLPMDVANSRLSTTCARMQPARPNATNTTTGTTSVTLLEGEECGRSVQLMEPPIRTYTD